MTENVMWPLPPSPPEEEQHEQDAPGSAAEALDADAWENLPPANKLATCCSGCAQSTSTASSVGVRCALPQFD